MRPRATALFLLALPLSTLASVAAAQERPSAAILQTQRSAGVDEGTGGSFDRMLRQTIDELEVATVNNAVVLDLEQVQIALGCLGETVQCLAAVTTELDVQILVVPSIDRAGDELVASVMVFDASDQSQRRASRHGPTQADLLEEVDPMLRELFGLPAPAPGERTERLRRPPPGPSISPLPFVVMGAGVAALVVGGVLGAMHESDENAYREAFLPDGPRTTQEVDSVLALRSQAETEGYAAIGLFVGGGALVAGGLIWLLAAGNEDGSSPVAVLPYGGVEGGGVVLTGSFEGGSL